MNVVVCIKQVPDSWAEKQLQPGDLTLDRASVDAVLNDLDEYAVEAALQLTEQHGGEVTLLTMGPERAGEAIRKALSMGADAGVHVVDDSLHGSDALATSEVLAKALGTLTWDLVILGSESTDARMSVVPAMLAERLGAPQLTYASTITVDGRHRDGGAADGDRRRGPHGVDARGRVGRREGQRAALPVVQEHHGREEEAGDHPHPRPTSVSTAPRSASRPPGAASAKRPGAHPRPPACIVTDAGDGGTKLVEFLVEQKLV